jgi:hypothetical protein
MHYTATLWTGRTVFYVSPSWMNNKLSATKQTNKSLFTIGYSSVLVEGLRPAVGTNYSSIIFHLANIKYGFAIHSKNVLSIRLNFT